MRAIIGVIIIFAIIFYFAFLRKEGESREKGCRKIAITIVVLFIITAIILVLGAKGYFD